MIAGSGTDDDVDCVVEDRAPDDELRGLVVTDGEGDADSAADEEVLATVGSPC
jgi:hypothetical protein